MTIQQIFETINKSKNETLSFNVKSITLDGNNNQILKEALNLEDWNASVKEIDSQTLYIKSPFYEKPIVLKSKVTDYGLNVEASSAIHNKEVAEFLVQEYNFSKFNVSTTVGGRIATGLELFIIEVSDDRFVHDPTEFTKLGYTLKYWL